MIFVSFQEVPARFMSRPLVGLERTALYGSSLHLSDIAFKNSGSLKKAPQLHSVRHS